MLEHAGREARLPVSTEVLDPDHVDLAAAHIDVIEIGPDNMQNFVLLRAAGTCDRPVIIHRAPAATIDEWLLAAEYVLDGGNDAAFSVDVLPDGRILATGEDLQEAYRDLGHPITGVPFQNLEFGPAPRRLPSPY